MTSLETKKRPVKLIVCLNCDGDAACAHTPEAAGRGWFKRLKTLFSNDNGVEVVTTNCLGGCDCVGAKGGNDGCCSVGLMGEGKFGFVLNQLVPEQDDAKVREFVRRYQAEGDGRLHCADEPDLMRHVATRLPALKD